ncbi:MAG: hypothetical protein HXY22_03060 [Alphaproteobacteria bacterium]|nr:hypothetical protein [Alphaproteobacteria bacterium]
MRILGIVAIGALCGALAACASDEAPAQLQAAPQFVSPSRTAPATNPQPIAGAPIGASPREAVLAAYGLPLDPVPYRMGVREKALETDRLLYPACIDREVTAYLEPARILDRIADTMVEEAGAREFIVYPVIVSGCGLSPRRMNTLVVVQMGQEPRYVRMLTGYTIAWPALQSDVVSAVALATMATVKVVDPACYDAVGLGHDRAQVTDTRVLSGSYPSRMELGVAYEGSWREVWTVMACGKRYEPQVQFTPDGKGGAIFEISAGPSS